MQTFKSILEFQKHFNTDEKCRQYLESQRWNGVPACPFCGSINVHRFATDKKIFKCREKECRKKFSVTVGTIYENTKIPLSKWFLATYILTVHSKGISSLQLATWLNVTQKTAWFLNHRIREMLTDKAPEQLNGIVEVDEVYLGGKESNKHASKKKAKGGTVNKSMVVGAVKRQGKVITKVIPKASTANIQKVVTDFVQPDSTMLTDENQAYYQLKELYTHKTVSHQKKEYVRGWVHTNTIEGYWNILRKQIDGIHHFVSPKHLQRYCNENAFRYNNRLVTQDERFAGALSNCDGRLKYADLTKKQPL